MDGWNTYSFPFFNFQGAMLVLGWVYPTYLYCWGQVLPIMRLSWVVKSQARWHERGSRDVEGAWFSNHQISRNENSAVFLSSIKVGETLTYRYLIHIYIHIQFTYAQKQSLDSRYYPVAFLMVGTPWGITPWKPDGFDPKMFDDCGGNWSTIEEVISKPVKRHDFTVRMS